MKTLLICLALIIFMVGGTEALQIEYMQARSFSETVPFYPCGNNYFLIDIKFFSLNTLETGQLLLQAYAEFEIDNPELEIVDRGPFIYGSDGNCYYYYIKCAPRKS